jgi:IS30 family transposase
MKIVAEHLKLCERQVIYSMRESGKGVRAIAKVIVCPPSTISRELKRKKPDLRVWSSMSSLERAKWMDDQARFLRSDWKRGPRTDLEKWDVQGKVHEAIVEGKRSAEQTAMILQQSDGAKVSGSTIRRHAEADKGLKKHFPQKGKKQGKKQKVDTSNGMLPLSERPYACSTRQRFGDMEIDLIVSSKSLDCILVVRERGSRKMWAVKLLNKQADTVRQGLFKIFKDIPPPLALTATYDRGKEFSDLKSFSKAFQIENYVCNPYCSWEKGCVENGNLQLRRFFPSGMDLAEVTQEALDKALHWINITPMLVLGKRSPNDVWFLACKNIKEMLH